jgi:hypothetical protein
MAGTVKIDYCGLHEEKRIGGRSAVQDRERLDLKPSVPGGRSGLSRAAVGVGDSGMASLEIGYA